MLRELVSKGESSNLIGCWLRLVEKRLGGPDAIIINGRTEAKAWRFGRVMAFREGQVMQAPETPAVFYSRTECARRLECASVHQIKELLGAPDYVYIADGGKELPIWSHRSLNAAFQLVQDARSSGSKEFDRKRAFKPRIIRQQRDRLARFARVRSLIRPKPVSRVRFCSPRHVWADPEAVEACRVR